MAFLEQVEMWKQVRDEKFSSSKKKQPQLFEVKPASARAGTQRM